MIEIQIFFFSILNIVSFLWKHNTFVAVYCTLLNNSYVLRYIFIEKQKNKNGGGGGRKKEGRKEGPEQDSNRAPSARCDFT